MKHAWAIVRSLFVGVTVGLSAGMSYAVAANDVSGNSQASSGAPAGLAQNNVPQKFDILEYVVDGNTVLSVPEIEEAVYPFLGESRGAADVDKARDALEQVYRERGFQTVQVAIPKQGIENGIIHLQVVENPVGRLRVVDSKYHTLDEIKQTAPSLAEGTVPNLNDVQKDIVALNQQPDMKVTPHLKAGQAPGTVDVDLQVEDHLPLHENIEINNQYNQQTTPLRAVGTLSYDNLWQLGHSMSLTVQVAPERPNDAKVFSASYLVPFPQDSFSLLVYGVKSDSDVAAIAGTDVVGKGDIFGVRGILNLPGSDTFYESLTVGFDRKDLTQNVVTDGEQTKAPVLYYPISISYAPTWHNDDALTQANLSLNFALPGVGDDSAGFDAQRIYALRQYIYAKASVSETLPLSWGLSLFGQIQGQIADGALLSSEQFSAGGANSERGYLEAERLGDDAIETNVELRSPSVGPEISPLINDWHFLMFYDSALLTVNQPLPGEQATFKLIDAGVGTRFSAFNILNGSVDVAMPFVSSPATKVGHPRIHFRFWAGL